METETLTEESRNQINPLAFSRRHPDVFTKAEATAYLGLKSTISLDTLEKTFGLASHIPAGREKLYHREDLDACAKRMFGKDIKRK